MNNLEQIAYKLRSDKTLFQSFVKSPDKVISSFDVDVSPGQLRQFELMAQHMRKSSLITVSGKSG
jgi:hypothetical protein